MNLQRLLDRAGVTHYTAGELLTRGASHFEPGPGHGLNRQAPEELWPQMVAVAMLAERLRVAFGHPLQVLSCYRSPEYNRAIGGAPASLHCLGKAIDLAPVNGDVAGLVRAARSLHTRGGKLHGGLGVYPWGVHVDTGRFRDW